MKKLSKIKFIFILLFLAGMAALPGGASALILKTENFNSQGYPVWTTGGATHAYLPTGGWDGNGAARFTVPTSADAYSGTTVDNFTPSSPVYIRWVLKTATNFHSASDLGKHIIVNEEGEGDGSRAIMIDHQCDPTHSDLYLGKNVSPGYKAFFPNCVFSYDCSSRKFNFNITDGAWITVETYMEAGQTTRTWITTRDGSLNEFETSYPSCNADVFPSGLRWHRINILGTYGGRGGGSFILDDLVISTTKIGPPAGFLAGGGGDTTPPASPTGLSVN